MNKLGIQDELKLTNQASKQRQQQSVHFIGKCIFSFNRESYRKHTNTNTQARSKIIFSHHI